jgi:hypothetical protein
LAEEARRVDALHESGYRFCWPPTIDNLTRREQRLLTLADHADAYQRQERRQQQQRDRPDHFGSVSQSRQDAFQ